jgi:hypothetical protein
VKNDTADRFLYGAGANLLQIEGFAPAQMIAEVKKNGLKA